MPRRLALSAEPRWGIHELPCAGLADRDGVEPDFGTEYFGVASSARSAPLDWRRPAETDSAFWSAIADPPAGISNPALGPSDHEP
jgi:hypothetical protein